MTHSRWPVPVASLAALVLLVPLACGTGARLGDGSPFPAEVDGLPVVTVSAALAAREAGRLGPHAVAGWFSMAPRHPCPAPFGPHGGFREPNPLELYCTLGDWALAELREPVVEVTQQKAPGFSSIEVRGRSMVGPWLQPVFDAAPPQPPDGWPNTWTAFPIVLIGHFGDVRGQNCQPDLVVACLERFVATGIGWPAGGP